MKAISDKNKIEILNCFELEIPMTVTEIADKLGLPYSKINYHIKLLEKVGIIEVVDTKIKSGIIEKYYLPTAEEFRIDKSICVFENTTDLDEYKKQVKKFYDSIFKNIGDDYKSWVQNLSPGEPNEGAMFCSAIFLNELQAKELKQDIEAYFKSILDKYGDKAEGTKAYNVGNFLIVKKNQSVYFDELEETEKTKE